MRSVVFLLAMALAAPGVAWGQQDSGLANMVSDLILNGIVLPGGAAPGNPHSGHFTLGDPLSNNGQPGSRADAAAIAAVLSFSDRFRAQFANFPLGTSTGGFTFTRDATGTYQRGSTSFGPAFAERARTIGRGKLSAGVNYQHTSFDTFGGLDLDDGSVTFYLPHTDCCPPNSQPTALTPGMEGDLVEASLQLEASIDTVLMMANYGVTDRLDLGVALPISNVSLDANVHATIIRLSSAGATTVHTFSPTGGDQITSDIPREGSSTGIGDMVLRSKYMFYSAGETGIAAAVDLRLPTGDEDNLLGIGTTQAKVYAIASAGNDRFATHFNFGFTISGTGERQTVGGFTSLGVSDEVNYAGGIEYVPHPTVTIIGDILGRTLLDAGQVEPVNKTYQFRVGAGATAADPVLTSSTNPITNQPYRQLELSSGSPSLLLGAVGAKYNVAPNLLISGHVLFPLNNSGLRDLSTIAIGIDYAF
jgi:hypothetical protein